MKKNVTILGFIIINVAVIFIFISQFLMAGAGYSYPYPEDVNINMIMQIGGFCMLSSLIVFVVGVIVTLFGVTLKDKMEKK